MPTRHEIINHMLSVVGEGGVSYDAVLHPTVQACNRVLVNEDTEIQSKGWWFNTEYSLTLVPDNTGRVVVPTEALDMTLSGVSNMGPEDKTRYVRRSNMIYDTVQHTNVINRSVVVDVIMRLDIDDMPAVAQSYLMRKAAETIFLDEDGDTSKLSKLEQRTMLAWQALQAAQLKNIAVNALDGNFNRSLQSGWRGSSGGRNPNLIGGRIR